MVSHHIHIHIRVSVQHPRLCSAHNIRNCGFDIHMVAPREVLERLAQVLERLVCLPSGWSVGTTRGGGSPRMGPRDP
eukprot:3447314-Pyramimonas_sp.AAC.1